MEAFPFGRYDTLLVSALVDLVTLTFILGLGAHCCPWGGQPSRQLYRMFRSRIIGQHLSDESRDLVILEVTALVADAGLRIPSVYQV